MICKQGVLPDNGEEQDASDDERQGDDEEAHGEDHPRLLPPHPPPQLLWARQPHGPTPDHSSLDWTGQHANTPLESTASLYLLSS